MSSGGGRLVAGAALAHHVAAHRAVGHLGAEVHHVARGRRGASRYSGKRLPAPLDAGGQRGAGDVLDALHQPDQPLVPIGRDRREADAAVAHHHGGDAVPARRRELRVPGGLAVVVGVDVDEAGRDERAVGVDLARARRRRPCPTAVTTPSVMATSAVRAGAPVPSTTCPPRITRSVLPCVPLKLRRPQLRRRSDGPSGRCGSAPGQLDVAAVR